ncbi:HlyD family type I secretion periplasmic adaptor subunit [Zavarzinia compransoris]|uniref:Membrane fusion protein (MFP) family protein n=1 Tax=Zavarzinia compransoris TaxID=1264899 RepID=A0A317E3H4_9PROT|nr:HlyD family type I secretion periplasmic adaptor subunit [Zavarzinia compransoris]PWR21658.1 HlyD family type I secretion periplasmic adaptor subunit [Zavarzinia compransoris]TDP45561.1 HlyD family secretion protein [Zavarzinia compransoris]
MTATAGASLRRHARAGLGLVVLVLGGFLGWSLLAEVAGAVVAPGRIVVESDVKRIQHLEGGVVSEIHARNGDGVAAGQLLVRLDGTQARANLGIVESQVIALAHRRHRLMAERDGLAEPAGQPDQPGPALDAWRAEARVLAALRAARDGEIAQLREQIAQASRNTEGLQAQIKAKDRELRLIGEELRGVRELRQKELVPLPRLKALERDEARIAGERGQLLSTVAQTGQRIAELELQVIQVDTQRMKDVLAELREVETRLAELSERRIAAGDQLRRIDILSPTAGTIHESIVHTTGGVVGPGETLMLVVPAHDRLIIEAEIEPTGIDRVKPGMAGRVRFPAFDQRTTPEVTGTIDAVTPDASSDPQTGRTFYRARIGIERSALPPAVASALKPGMPAEIFIETASRTVLGYLVKPLQDQIAKTFIED